MTTCGPRSPPITSTLMRIKEKSAESHELGAHPQVVPVRKHLLNQLCSGSDGKDLTSFVVAAGWADPMRNIRGRTLRAGRELRQRQNAVVNSSLPLPAS